MIAYDRVISWAERRLGLRENQRYDRGDALVALSDTVDDISIHVPAHQTSDVTITTVSGQGTYPIPARSPLLIAISWPSAWNHLTISHMTQQQIEGIRLDMASGGTFTRDTQQPEFYGWWWLADGTAQFALESAQSIISGLTITLRVLTMPDYSDIISTPPVSSQVALNSTLEIVLKNGVCWRLAQIYLPERADYWQNQFESSIETWKVGMSPDLTQHFIETKAF